MSTRVLHVINRMDRGGAETWLMHVLRATDRRRVAMDFLVHSSGPADYDEEILRLGARIIPGPRPARPVAYGARLARILREQGPFDVVHSHVHHFSGLVLTVARARGVPIRIAHSHLDTSRMDAAAGGPRRAYLKLMEAALRSSATAGLAASAPAAAALFGPRWQADGRFRVLPCGLDFGPFHHLPDRAAARRALGLPEDALVIGHVGRFFPQKNHALVVRIAEELCRREPRARFVLVGDGPLRAEIEERVRAAGLGERVSFTGVRPDVPGVLAALDAFLFPSLYEGLGLAGVEAQAAGLPVVVSDTTPPELEVVPGLVRWCRLDDPPAAWASALQEAASAPRPSPGAALATVEASAFGLENSLRALEREYLLT